MTNLTITPEAARDLAIAYSAFNTAIDNNDDSGIAVWGEMLLAAQQDTGVELHGTASLTVCVKADRSNLNA